MVASLPPLHLASRSPRRRRLLTDARLLADVIDTTIDDGDLRPGRLVTPREWVIGLAYLKARAAADKHSGDGLILGADTVCVYRDQVLGQPRDADNAAAMLHAMRNATHETLSGVCLLHLVDGVVRCRRLMIDSARVTIGAISDDGIARYVASGAWRGKAGGYNLAERIEAGWPITCDGDPTTVMGLPMQRLPRWIELITSDAAASA